MPLPWFEPSHASPADLAACRLMLEGGSKTFFAASLLLPAEYREPASSLYAFCRLADDAIDLEEDRLSALAQLRARLHLAYSGRPYGHPVDRALADVVAQHGIPRAVPEALLEGFEWDAAGRRYETLADLKAYAMRVAGTVGTMMAIIMGVRGAEPIARACDLGVAMQLTNIARDVGEDARAGRLYLPLDLMREQGIDPEAWLRTPVYTAEIGAVVQKLLAAADVLYQRAAAGIAQLPLGCRPAIHAAGVLYAEIGRQIERNGLNSVDVRAVVGTRRKLALLAQAAALVVRPPRGGDPTTLPQARFLVEAVLESEHRTGDKAGTWWNFDDRVVWVVTLFDQLHRRKHFPDSFGRA